jgi:hypothetical protein
LAETDTPAANRNAEIFGTADIFTSPEKIG